MAVVGLLVVAVLGRAVVVVIGRPPTFASVVNVVPALSVVLVLSLAAVVLVTSMVVEVVVVLPALSSRPLSLPPQLATISAHNIPASA